MPERAVKLYVGIDPSLTRTAMLALDEDGCIRAAETIRPKSRGVERLAELLEATRRALKEASRAGEIARVAIEGYSLGSRNQRGVHAMAEWGGVLRLALYEAGLDWLEIPPTAAKKYAAGRGDAPKDRVALAVYKRWGVELQDEHQTDAYVLARMARDMDCAKPGELTKEQAVIIGKLLLRKLGEIAQEVEQHGA